MRILRFFSVFACIVILCSFSAFAADPVILAQPQNVYLPDNVELSVQVNFTVLAQGDNLTYQWQASRNNGQTWNNVDTSYGRSPNLLISVNETTVNGGRLYRCVITSNDGSVTSNVVSVSVASYIMESLPQLLSWINECTRSIFSWSVDCCGQIVQQPLLLFTVGFLALGGSIAVMSRLFRRS